MNLEQAKENWAYAQKALAEIHPSFKLHLGMPYDCVVVGFKEDVNPHNMFGDYFEKAVNSLGKKFEDIWFDFYNLDLFYARNLSFDLNQVAKETRRRVTIKDRVERLDQLVVRAENTGLIKIENREIGHIHERFEHNGSEVFQVNFYHGEDDSDKWEDQLFNAEDLLKIGAGLRGQRIIVDTYAATKTEILTYDHSADIHCVRHGEVDKIEMMITFSENKEFFLESMERELKDLSPEEREKKLKELGQRYDKTFPSRAQ